MSKHKTQSQQMFDSLVNNAINFLEQAIAEIKRKPKYSVINFFSSVELFLKARLMLEHWSLIYEDPKNANLTKFLEGDFRSVGLDEAINRLNNIAQVRITTKQEETFSELREHRNKLVHFFHPKYAGKPDKKTLEDVVIEQCRAWYYLYPLLTKNWKSEFSKYLSDIEKLHQSMRQVREYLQVRYEALKPDIEKGKARGTIFSDCPACGFEANREKQIIGPLITSKCLVCEIEVPSLLKVSCPNCKGAIYVYEFGEGKCIKCGKEINLDFLMDQFDEPPSHKEIVRGAEIIRAYCGECGYIEQPTVISYDDKWICLTCATLHETVDRCDWCNELVTGILEDSFIAGCMLCNGNLGWQMSKDD